MSKTHSRGRTDKSSHNHGYYNRNNTGEEKRPSVFDRLGTRRDNASSGSHYPSSEAAGGSYKSRSDPLKPHVHTQRSGHSSTKRGLDGGHPRSRSRSGSPRLKKKAVQSTVTHRSKSKGSISTIRDKEKTSSRKSSPKRNVSSKSKSKIVQSSSKSRGNTRTGTKKSMGAKGKGKIRSSSLSSEGSTSQGSTSTSSSHTRTTSSTATEASSSSSTAVTSTTESSVPSIKLKPAKKDKPKKKIKKKARVGVESSVEKPRHPEASVKRQSLSSSVSSRDSRKDSSHHYKETNRSKAPGGSWHKSPTRVGNNYERRSFSKSTGRPMEREKEQLTPGRSFDHVARGKERQNAEEESRKRRLSDDGYGASADGNYLGHKRSRTVPSPPPKYNKPTMNRRTPSPSPRRVPPDSSSMGHKFLPRRERSPPPRPSSKERERLRIIRSPHRRPSFEDHRRIDPSRKDRPHASSYGNGNKPTKDMERDRDRPFGHNAQLGPSSNVYDKSGYPQRDTSRPRDRFAPARPPSGMDRGRIAPKHSEPERERIPIMGKDRPKEYDSRPGGRLPPLLGSAPTNNKSVLPSKINQGQRVSHEDSRPRAGHGAPPVRHMPMIVKTKEALIERYEEQTIKQSRVDMWVDQTLQGTARVSVEPFECDKLPLKRLSDETRTPTPEENKDRCSSIGSISGINVIESTTKPEVEDDEKNLELSDFSDDADDILTQELKQTSPAKVESAAQEIVEEASVVPSDGNQGVINEPVKAVEENVCVDVDKDSVPTVVSTSSLPPPLPYDLRDVRSLQSQSQTDDDILERMDFEEISDDELGEVENKISIVDVFGVNWASLLSRDKSELPSNQSGVASSDSTLSKSVRQRWTPLQVFQQVGVSRKLCGETLFQKITDNIRKNLKISEDQPKDVPNIEEELEKPLFRRRRLERHSLLENYGLGPHSRALSAKRDMVVRRCLLNLPPKNLVSLEFGNQSSGPINAPQEPEFATELLKISVTNYKNS